MGAWRKAAMMAAVLAVLAGCASHGYGPSEEWRLRKLEEHALAADEEAMRKAERLQSLEDDLNARMAGMESRMDGQDKSLADLDARFAALARAPESTAAPAASVAAEPARPVEKMTAKAAPAPARPGAGEQAEYDKALAVLRAGKPEEGRKRFEAFVSSWPRSGLVPNALYWIGESHYNQDRFADAVISFRKVHQDHPRHAKAAAALLKMGMSYQKLGDVQNARFYWEALVQDYAGSEPAALARKLLSAIAK